MGSMSTTLTKATVKRIKELMVEGYSNAQLADWFPCTAETLSRIRRGASHKDVRVPGDEVLTRHLKRVAAPEGVGIILEHETVPRYEPAPAIPSTPLTPEQEAAAKAAEDKMAALQKQLDADAAAKKAKEEGDERIAAELETKGVQQDENYMQVHLTEKAKADLNLRFGEKTANVVGAFQGSPEDRARVLAAADAKIAAKAPPRVHTAAELAEIQRLKEGGV